MKKNIIKIFLFFILNHCLSAQNENKFVLIDSIKIEGNTKTKEKTILRELTFAVGDSVPFAEINPILEKNRLLLMNTTLFSKVKMNIEKWSDKGDRIQVKISITEGIQTIPYAYASLADRNFNVWWFEKGHDLKRVNYFVGARINNLTGTNNQLRALFQFGYGQKIDLTYRMPNIGKKKQFGFLTQVYRSRFKEVWYATRNDSLQFYNDESKFNLKKFRAAVGVSFRPKIRSQHFFKTQYLYDQISDGVLAKTTYFLTENKNYQRFLSAEYRFVVDYRNIRPYPTKGYFLALSAEKQGFFKKDNVNALYGTLLLGKFFTFSPKITTEFITKARYEFTGNRQPYYNTRAIGYLTDYLRGYEYYVIDGANFAYLKNSFRYEILNNKYDLGNFLPEKVRYIPYRLNIAVNNEFGKVQNKFGDPSNKLQNTLLWGKGIGLDLIVYYNIVVQFEYSVNHLKKGGFYAHMKLPLE